MNKCKIIEASNYARLEWDINDFIEDKQVISVSIDVTKTENVIGGFQYLACIIYEN